MAAAEATKHLERCCKELEEKLGSRNELMEAHTTSEKRCESLEIELAELRADLQRQVAAGVELEVAAERERFEKSQHSMQQKDKSICVDYAYACALVYYTCCFRECDYKYAASISACCRFYQLQV
jgi:hypothetical protein